MEEYVPNEQYKTTERVLNEIKISNHPEKEFQVVSINMMTELGIE